MGKAGNGKSKLNKAKVAAHQGRRGGSAAKLSKKQRKKKNAEDSWFEQREQAVAAAAGGEEAAAAAGGEEAAAADEVADDVEAPASADQGRIGRKEKESGKKKQRFAPGTSKKHKRQGLPLGTHVPA